MRIGLITNPNSQRNKEDAGAIAAAIAKYPHLLVAKLHKISELPEALHRFAEEMVDLIIIDGGDGTVAAAVTTLLRSRPFFTLPKLAILPGGMTNLIARDVGLRGYRAHSLDRLMKATQNNLIGTEINSRTALRVQIGTKPAQFGFFFGTAAAYSATILSRQKFHTIGAKQSIAAAAGIIGALWTTLFGGKRGPFAKGVSGTIIADDSLIAEGRRFLTLASTLNHLMLGFWPFWNEGKGPIHYIDISAPPNWLFAALPTFFTGRPYKWMRNAGYNSGQAKRLLIKLDTPAMLDGEILVPQGHETIMLSAEHVIDFIRV